MLGDKKCCKIKGLAGTETIHTARFLSRQEPPPGAGAAPPIEPYVSPWPQDGRCPLSRKTVVL